MDERYGYLNRQGSGVWRLLRDGDFEEADVWDVLKERKDYGSSKVTKSIDTIPSSVPRKLPSAARMIPRNTSHGGGGGSSSSGNSVDGTKAIKQQSAPVKIPDWSKIQCKKSKKTSSKNGFRLNYGDEDEEEDHRSVHEVDDSDEEDGDGYYDDEEEEEVYNDKLPPHEMIARRLARSQISSFSVFEGVGRTLKGRDLSKVRNAVLTKTGFLER